MRQYLNVYFCRGVILLLTLPLSEGDCLTIRILGTVFQEKHALINLQSTKQWFPCEMYVLRRCFFPNETRGKMFKPLHFSKP